MARRKTRQALDKIVAGSEPAQEQPRRKIINPDEPDDLATGRTVSIGVGLKEGEIAALDNIADRLGVARNALLRYAARHFIHEYHAGRLDLEVETKQESRLKMD